MMTDERPAPAPSDRRLLVQAQFDQRGLGEVGAWIEARRNERMSWGTMSRELWVITGMAISYETLRRWHQEDLAS